MTFVWIDGAPLTYSNWQPGDPNDPNGSNDLVYMIGPKWSSHGEWVDADGMAETLVCEKRRRMLPGEKMF
jgi:hypothetical protein